MKHGSATEAHKRLVLHVQTKCDWLSLTSFLSLLMNEFAVRRVIHCHLFFAAVDRNSVVYEVLNCFKI